MTGGREAIVESWERIRATLRGNKSLREDALRELPLRSELFSAEQMERHGRALARAHKPGMRHAPDRLLARLAANERMLGQAHDLLIEAVSNARRITPAGEWLIDNYHLVEEQVRLARLHLPRNYSRELPQLVEGPSAGLPRVYDIALEAISHGDGCVDTESLSHFVVSYQTVAPLALGELWAIPIMLRLALIENLRRVAASLFVDRLDRNVADAWADRMTEVAERDPKNLVLTIADMARSEPPQSSAFVAELARRLQGHSSALALPLSWIEQWIGESGQTIEQLVHMENQRQAADQVTISNSIGSIRYLSAMDWREFVESLSVVEQALREDPSGTYARMQFATRDRYRHVVERVARRSRECSEAQVAALAVSAAQRGAIGHGRDAVAAHVGYHLIGDGLPELERQAGCRPSTRLWRPGSNRSLPLRAFLAPVLIWTIAIAAALVLQLRAGGLHGALLWLLGIACVLAASDLALALVNWASTLLVAPHPLPRMDFSEGLPSKARTLVVVPTMLSSHAGVEQLIQGLEVRFLANRGPHIHFALLTDFLDAPAQEMPSDAPLLELARALIADLNVRYADEYGEDRFFLLHRARAFNARDKVWMGRERKRGKLADLNALLRKGDASAFAVVEGDASPLGAVRYVITLDSDTQLPREAVRDFVGTMAHPLNQPRVDEGSGLVVAGHAILQPRVGAAASGAPRTRFARWFGSEPGIDPYTRAVSDVYQDLFDEGSFIGKGIYEVEAFERVLEGRFPDNAILSHDLLEGCYARAGLMSDAQVFEEHPARYASDAARRHRWIRGDWQLLPWLLPRVRRQDGTRERNVLSALSRWKLFDNLRRSVSPIALLALFVAGWVVSASVAAWTLCLLALLLAAPVIALLLEALRWPDELPIRLHAHRVATSAGRHAVRLAVYLACLPYEAWYATDAIVRTLWRLAFSRRHLLQWNPSSEVERKAPTGLAASCAAMWFAPAFAIVLAAWLAWARPLALVVAMPLLAAWLFAPLLAWWISKPPLRREAAFDASQRRFLHGLARRTWEFFATHVGPEDHWLPPDNVQEQPVPAVAHRTSPTNIGMSLLASLSAADFGYITAAELIERCDATFATLGLLERHRGHFYNWYDTQTLQPLAPRYVSTVDSGNFVAHLLVLAEGLRMLGDAPLFGAQTLGGLADTFERIEEHAEGVPPTPLSALRQELDASRVRAPAALRDGYLTLLRTTAMAEALCDAIPASAAQAKYWALALQSQCRSAMDDLRWCAPWLGTEAEHPPEVPPLPSLRDLARHAGAVDGADGVHATLAAAAERALERIERLERLADTASEFADMEFGFLYHRGRNLLSIGYNADLRHLDEGHYDLLASEARLSIFVAIARGELPQDGWFALGRQLTMADGDPVLLSWSGSMFEYLMPQLVMPLFDETLLDATMRGAVARQIEYGAQRDVPWGISESGYNVFDAHLNYQYRAFGVPGLGFKQGLAQDLVVAPYATALALMVAPEPACANLRRLVADGYVGAFGPYEAIDFTASRLPRGQSAVVIRSFMAHHQGMSLLAYAYVLLGRPMQRRFMASRAFQSALLLLQERIPHTAVAEPRSARSHAKTAISDAAETRLRVFTSPDTLVPAVQMLSNGRYHLMVTCAGGGYSRLREMSVTRWSEDATTDAQGSYCYLRDVEQGAFWSTAYLPTRVPVDGYEAIFSDARAEFRGRKSGIDTHSEIVVSPEDDIELRRVTVTNRSRGRRTIELTSYAEVVLSTAAADAAHPAFSKMFVQAELMRPKQAILCNRRPQGEHDPSPWMFHLVAVHGADVQAISYETDRSRFIGRGRDLAHPVAMDEEALSDSQGFVLDPVVAIRVRLELEPDQHATVDFVTGAGERREGCVALIEKYRDRRLADRVFDLAWTHSQVVRRQINASQSDAQLYERLAGSILYANPVLRAEPGVLLANRRGQSGLWGYSISGDLPIVLVRIASHERIELVRQIVQAHAYWRLKGLAVDLVIWNEDQAGYRQQLQDQIMGLIAAGVEAHVIEKPGGIFVRASQQMSNEDRILIQAVARIVLSDDRGGLAEQVARRRPAEALPAKFAPAATAPPAAAYGPAALDPIALRHGNGFGGFSADGREYVIESEAGAATPAPWCNVLANARFGCVVSEGGLGYSWAENAHEFRLTPWRNDPVTDACGEAYYLRDEESGRTWSPTPLPLRGEGAYRIRHGFGYSVYEHVEDGIASELWVYVAIDAPVKYAVLRLRNRSGRSRRISVIGQVEWVLGDLREKSLMHVVTEQDRDTGAVVARNPYNAAFGDRVAFFDVDRTSRSVTGDRTEFIGRNGSLRRPAALGRVRLSGRVGPGLDPCAAIGTTVSLFEDQEQAIVFRLGAGLDEREAASLLRSPRDPEAAQRALDAVRAHWCDALGTVQVSTPDAALDALANGWLLYQVMACRYWGRSGYYQSGGAYGFRDQLQDTMAMVHAAPALVREHIVRCASHQFVEGDVQHWWHPPQDRGVRTHCSDDYLWLPCAVARYVQVTGDREVLDAMAHYVEGRAVNADEESYYDLPLRSTQQASVYEHCRAAIERGLSLRGERGLPLMGSGDWNDGMNRVGAGGKGESVWLGFFLHDVLQRFGELASRRGDAAFAGRCAGEAEKLATAIESHAWDGAWYRRAWYDDGTPLGTKGQAECEIDSLAQSWSVLSGVGDPERQRAALRALDERLVRRDTRIVQLLEPPFHRTAAPPPDYHDPGYIAAYPPGVRENGGQYTHAAVWSAMAFARSGDASKAWELARMLNPVRHGDTREGIATYMVEPYVMAADVYSVAPHTGRGGWTWYTGSAGWMYRLVVESLLGLRREGDLLRIEPCVTTDWPSYGMEYRFGASIWRITVQIAVAAAGDLLRVDGVVSPDGAVHLVDDGREHVVEVRVSPSVPLVPAPTRHREDDALHVVDSEG